MITEDKPSKSVQIHQSNIRLLHIALKIQNIQSTFNPHYSKKTWKILLVTPIDQNEKAAAVPPKSKSIHNHKYYIYIGKMEGVLSFFLPHGHWQPNTKRDPCNQVGGKKTASYFLCTKMQLKLTHMVWYSGDRERPRKWTEPNIIT